MDTRAQRAISLLLVLYLFLNTASVDGKRIYGGSSRKSSGSSSSRSRTHISRPSHSSNHDLTKLSYANSHAQAPSHSNFGSSTLNRGHQASAPASNAAPIGWNVPKAQGPPPSYSAVNPAGGAKTNIHEAPPAYRSNNPAYNPSAPSYPGATNTNSRSFTPAQNYRPRYNSTGGFGGGSGFHTPITATNAGHGVQSSYPRQQVPAGATYYPSSSSLPAGASYHPAGSSLPAGASYHPAGSSFPAGASYHPAGAVPHGATYYPSNSHLPPGATYHPAGHIPQGANYYPSGGYPAASHYPSAPAGATFLPAGAALPPNAVFYSQPPKSSSGLGFGSGLAAGALGGALLGHALTPSRTYTQQVSPGYNSAPAQPHDDKIIIINNGPPGSVSTTNAADGVTVINSGAAQSQPAQPAFNQPAQPASIPQATPVQPPAQSTLNPASAPLNPQPPTNQASAPLAPIPATNAADTNAAAAPSTPAEQPPPNGGIICVPVRVPQPDPKDATKTIEVEQIACYPAPPPEASAVASSSDSTTNTATASTSTSTSASTTLATQTPITTKDGASLAPFQTPTTPFVAPEGTVPLAPLNPSAQPDIMHMPGEPIAQHQTSSTAMLAPGSNLHVASSAMSKHFDSFTLPCLLTFLLAYCLH